MDRPILSHLPVRTGLDFGTAAPGNSMLQKSVRGNVKYMCFVDDGTKNMQKTLNVDLRYK